MGDPGFSDPTVGGADLPDGVDGSSNRRGRLALGLLLIALLLLCAITTMVETFVSKTPDQIRVVTKNLECLQCHSELIPQMSWPSVHDPFVKKQCTTCHTPHGHVEAKSVVSGISQTWERTKTLIEWLPLKFVVDVFYSGEGKTGETGGKVVSTTETKVKDKDSTPTASEDELCWICHGNLGPYRKMAYPHEPFKDGYCTNCHDPHASKFRVLLTQDERDLCVTCHRLGPELARTQVHPPVEGRFCTNCHHPHGSEYKGVLVANQRDLCFTCHPSVAPLSLKPVQHEPFLDARCTECHEPHGSDYPPLLIKNQPPLCYDCHPGIQYDFLKKSHHPVGTVKLDCTGCHDPHGADYPALLAAKDNEMCYQCHRVAIQATYDKSAHYKTLCIRCHTPHGSDYGPLLLAPNPDVCLRCHPAADFDESSSTTYRNNHPVRPRHYDVKAREPLTCTSTCHNPHGTAHNYMLRYYDFPSDGNCLICHQVVPGKRVGIDF
ncbi:MAG: cytochrome c3 family protein [Actinomycetia bacterium]|nr:cytochrome c3 family protein [Actinomycetes bacterium]